MKLFLKKGTHLQLEKTYQVLTSSKNTRNHRHEGNVSWFLTVQSSKQELSKVLVRFQPKNKPGGSLTLSDIMFFSGKKRGRQKKMMSENLPEKTMVGAAKVCAIWLDAARSRSSYM